MPRVTTHKAANRPEVETATFRLHGKSDAYCVARQELWTKVKWVALPSMKVKYAFRASAGLYRPARSLDPSGTANYSVCSEICKSQLVGNQWIALSFVRRDTPSHQPNFLPDLDDSSATSGLGACIRRGCAAVPHHRRRPSS